MSTNLMNPHYLPEITINVNKLIIKVTIVNFSITMEGLDD